MMPYWDERVGHLAARFPDVRVDKYHIDILAVHGVFTPTGSMSWWPAICSATSCRI